MRTLCIYEGAGTEKLHPLVYMRPAYDLRCGITTLRQKIARIYPGLPLALHCRPYLADLVREQNPGIAVNSLPEGDVLFVDGRIIAGGTPAIPLTDRMPCSSARGPWSLPAWAPPWHAGSRGSSRLS